MILESMVGKIVVHNFTTMVLADLVLIRGNYVGQWT
jgi:hypothetical protein